MFAKGKFMKAIVVQSEQEGRPLVWQDVPAPVLQPDEVRVAVQATALNRADLMQRAGNYPPPPGASSILGLETAGKIIEVGPEVSGWQVGDAVCALLPGGGYAEQVTVPHQLLMPVPAGWSFLQAGAMPEVFYTAFVNLFLEAAIQPGEVALVHGGAGGVGTAAVQLLKKAGHTVIVTAGTDKKTAFCRKLGADLAINYRQEDFAEAVRTYTGGVDVILDMVGANYLHRNVRLLKVGGRLVFIAMLSGGQVEFDLGSLLGRRLRLIGSVLRSRSVAEKIAIKEQFMTRFWPAAAEGTITPVIDAVYPIEQANDAHRRMSQNKNIGKIVLQVSRQG